MDADLARALALILGVDLDLKQMPFKRLLEAVQAHEIDAAISGNRYPESRPMYVVVRMKIDGEVGNKKIYDPRAWMKVGESAMCDRVKEACNDLHSVGKSLLA